ncbi:MAG TPA: GNAT family N-acetyltransferase [Solirubrobacterales bacterium]|nr:GNAT family N-acetyltransferase [Solirubrobacterales bacterium]
MSGSRAIYPAEREAEVVLSDGSTIHVRPVRPEDEDALHEFLEWLDPEARMFRFFSIAVDLRRAGREMATVDYVERYGLVATRGVGEPIVGQGMYITERPGRAEVAFAVADRLRGTGLGTLLLAHLAETASANGIEIFTAEVMPHNHRMLEVFRESGFPIETSSEPGSIHVELPTSFAEEAVRRFEDRDRLAAASALRHFLEPSAIAVIGASRERETVGGQLFHNALESGFEGVVYPVNPSADVVQAVHAYRSVADLPEDVDLAVIAVPAAAVVDLARQCGERGIPALVVISAGFAESGPEGGERERELVEVCRAAGMRLVGPNCLGILNNTRAHPINVTFAPGTPPPGDVGFVSQSGALGLALIDLAWDRGLGVSSFGSIGNRADITANDFLEYWESDPETQVALLYIESFSDPRRFSRVARRIGREMPVVVVKSGRSAAGQRATSSHTGALLAASDVTADALFEQAGVIRTETLSELLDVSSLLSSQPLPEGRRIGIVTNAGGPGIMCADACEAAGLEVPELPEEVRASLRGILPDEAGLLNPVDMIATATAEHYRETIRSLAEWDGVDALIVIFIRPLLTRAVDVAGAIEEAAGQLTRRLPIQAVFMSPQDHGAIREVSSLPIHSYPEDAARALGRVMRHVEWRRRPPEKAPGFDDVDTESAAALIAEALESGEGWIQMDEASRLLGFYRIPIPAWSMAPDPQAAAEAAEKLGGSVALKGQGPGLLHKSEMGAVRAGLSGGEEVRSAAEAMDSAVAAAGGKRESFIVQTMAEPGPEMLVGVVEDPTFGPVLACGAGGTQAELLTDVAVRICPVTRSDVSRMLRSLRTFPLLTGYRGAPPVDLDALEGLLLRVSAMVDSHHEIAEMDLNPVIAGPGRAVAVDYRIRVQAAPPRRPWPRTWK